MKNNDTTTMFRDITIEDMTSEEFVMSLIKKGSEKETGERNPNFKPDMEPDKRFAELVKTISDFGCEYRKRRVETPRHHILIISDYIFDSIFHMDGMSGVLPDRNNTRHPCVIGSLTGWIVIYINGLGHLCATAFIGNDLDCDYDAMTIMINR